ERGVVLEEWRGNRGATERMMQTWLPIAFKGSRYALRIPIGSDTIIKSAQPSLLRRFYKDWYRPDLQAVIAVGDFDPAVIEAQIKKHFSSIPRPTNAPRRTVAAVPGNKAPLVVIATDKEAIGTNVSLYFKLPRDSFGTVGD